jgi:hypothetical protein
MLRTGLNSDGGGAAGIFLSRLVGPPGLVRREDTDPAGGPRSWRALAVRGQHGMRGGLGPMELARDPAGMS